MKVPRRLVGVVVVILATAIIPELGLATVSAPDVTQPLPNGGFESGHTDWLEFSLQGQHFLIWHANEMPVPPYGGSWAAWLGRVHDEISFVYQDLTVPEGSSVFLRYWHWIESWDSCGYDFGYVVINDLWQDTYDLCQATNTGEWVLHSVNISRFAGQFVRLEIWGVTDSTYGSNLYVDDVYFDFTGSPPSPIFADGFESGDTGRWAATAP